MSEPDWVAEAFPGDPLELPSDGERNVADWMIEVWGGGYRPIPRTYPVTTYEGFANPLAGEPTNRAFIRHYLRHWWRITYPRKLS